MLHGWIRAWQSVEKKRKDYAFRRQFNEKPSIIPGCPGLSFCKWVLRTLQVLELWYRLAAAAQHAAGASTHQAIPSAQAHWPRSRLHLPAFFLRPRYRVVCLACSLLVWSWLSQGWCCTYSFVPSFFLFSLTRSLTHSLLRSFVLSFAHSFIDSFVYALCVFLYRLVTYSPLIASYITFYFGTQRTDNDVCRCCTSALWLSLLSTFLLNAWIKPALYSI